MPPPWGGTVASGPQPVNAGATSTGLAGGVDGGLVVKRIGVLADGFPKGGLPAPMMHAPTTAQSTRPPSTLDEALHPQRRR